MLPLSSLPAVEVVTAERLRSSRTWALGCLFEPKSILKPCQSFPNLPRSVFFLFFVKRRWNVFCLKGTHLCFPDILNLLQTCKIKCLVYFYLSFFFFSKLIFWHYMDLYVFPISDLWQRYCFYFWFCNTATLMLITSMNFSYMWLTS